MNIGMYLPIYGGWFKSSIEEKERPPTYEYVKKTALKAESIGIDSLWIPDHLLNPLKGEEAPSLEAWTLATAVAEATEQVNISHTTLCEAFRYPAVLAKQTSTLDEISNGRFWLSLGAGWYKREYEAYGLNFDDHDNRIDRARETIEIIERLWDEDRVNYHGDYYWTKKGIVEPKPDPRPPIWYAGMSGPSRELVAEKVDGWLLAADKLDNIKDQISDMDKRLKEFDRDSSDMEYAVPAITFLGKTDEEAEQKLKKVVGKDEKSYKAVTRKGIVGGLETVEEKMEKMKDVGVDHLILQLTPTHEELDIVEELLQA